MTEYDDELNHYDITRVTHATLEINAIWKDSNDNPVDLTGYTARMQARDTEDATTAWFDVDEGDYIALGGAAGTVDVAVPPAITGTVTADDGVYDLMLTSPGGVTTRFLWGCVCVDKGITHD